jgi:hypothetical protein
MPPATGRVLHEVERVFDRSDLLPLRAERTVDTCWSLAVDAPVTHGN